MGVSPDEEHHFELLGVMWGTELIILLKREVSSGASPSFKKKSGVGFLFIFKRGRKPPFSLTNSWLHFGTDKFKQDENQITSVYLIRLALADNIINVAVEERKSILENFFPLLQTPYLRLYVLFLI